MKTLINFIRYFVVGTIFDGKHLKRKNGLKIFA